MIECDTGYCDTPERGFADNLPILLIINTKDKHVTGLKWILISSSAFHAVVKHRGSLILTYNYSLCIKVIAYINLTFGEKLIGATYTTFSTTPFAAIIVASDGHT